MNPLLRSFLLSAIRNGLKVAGLVGLFTDAQINDVLSAVLVLIGFGWTIFNDFQKNRAQAA